MNTESFKTMLHDFLGKITKNKPQCDQEKYVDGVSDESEGIRVYDTTTTNDMIDFNSIIEEALAIISDNIGQSKQNESAQTDNMCGMNNVDMFAELFMYYDDPSKQSSIDFDTIKNDEINCHLLRLAAEFGLPVEQYGSLNNTVLDPTKFPAPNKAIADFLALMCYFTVGREEFMNYYYDKFVSSPQKQTESYTSDDYVYVEDECIGNNCAETDCVETVCTEPAYKLEISDDDTSIDVEDGFN